MLRKPSAAPPVSYACCSDALILRCDASHKISSDRHSVKIKKPNYSPRPALEGFPAESGYGEQQCSPEQIGIRSTNWHECRSLCSIERRPVQSIQDCTASDKVSNKAFSQILHVFVPSILGELPLKADADFRPRIQHRHDTRATRHVRGADSIGARSADNDGRRERRGGLVAASRWCRW